MAQQRQKRPFSLLRMTTRLSMVTRSGSRILPSEPSNLIIEVLLTIGMFDDPL